MGTLGACLSRCFPFPANSPGLCFCQTPLSLSPAPASPLSPPAAQQLMFFPHSSTSSCEQVNDALWKCFSFPRV